MNFRSVYNGYFICQPGCPIALHSNRLSSFTQMAFYPPVNCALSGQMVSDHADGSPLSRKVSLYNIQLSQKTIPLVLKMWSVKTGGF